MKYEKLKEWKKVLLSDLDYLSSELKEYLPLKSILILTGDLGAGKTTLLKKLIDDGETLSPSYSLLSETNSSLHADFYRIEKVEELTHLEIPLYLEDKDFFFIEWGEKFLSYIVSEYSDEFSIFSLKILSNENSGRSYELGEIKEF